jgi:hypothetical protein
MGARHYESARAWAQDIMSQHVHGRKNKRLRDRTVGRLVTHILQVSLKLVLRAMHSEGFAGMLGERVSVELLRELLASDASHSGSPLRLSRDAGTHGSSSFVVCC